MCHIRCSLDIQLSPLRFKCIVISISSLSDLMSSTLSERCVRLVINLGPRDFTFYLYGSVSWNRLMRVNSHPIGWATVNAWLFNFLSMRSDLIWAHNNYLAIRLLIDCDEVLIQNPSEGLQTPLATGSSRLMWFLWRAVKGKHHAIFVVFIYSSEYKSTLSGPLHREGVSHFPTVPQGMWTWIHE